jgi:hypothetical protein
VRGGERAVGRVLLLDAQARAVAPVAASIDSRPVSKITLSMVPRTSVSADTDVRGGAQ